MIARLSVLGIVAALIGATAGLWARDFARDYAVAWEICERAHSPGNCQHILR